MACSQRDDAALKMFCSIAFPAISTGVYGYPLEDATEIAVDTVADWLQSHADYDMKVIFCCFDARTRRRIRQKWSKH